MYGPRRGQRFIARGFNPECFNTTSHRPGGADEYGYTKDYEMNIHL